MTISVSNDFLYVAGYEPKNFRNNFKWTLSFFQPNFWSFFFSTTIIVPFHRFRTVSTYETSMNFSQTASTKFKDFEDLCLVKPLHFRLTIPLKWENNCHFVLYFARNTPRVCRTVINQFICPYLWIPTYVCKDQCSVQTGWIVTGIWKCRNCSMWISEVFLNFEKLAEA